MRSELWTDRSVRRSILRRGVLAGGVLIAAAVALSACTSTTDGRVADSPVARTTSASSSPSSASQSPVGAAVLTLPSKVSSISPATPITVSVASGTITSADLVNQDGKHVKSAISDDGTSWSTSEVLGYSKTYKLTVDAKGTDGSTVTKKATITTLTPDNLTLPYINSTGGLPLQNGATYGVGLVPVVHFDEPVTDRKAAERALEVTTVPHVDGVWNWIDAQNVHYRPKDYWPSGTKVTINAKVYGVRVGTGLYGQQDVGVSFTIGDKRVTVADDTKFTVKVYFSDKLVKTMPTSMGQHIYVDGKDGQKISLWTMRGTYTVIGHEDPATMSSASFGLPANSPYGYAPEKVYKATKISTDGIYLHSAPWSVWAQGHSDQSHGCLNLSPDNATWYYDHSRIGDVVIVKNPGAPAIQIYQNGDWSVPWSTWVKGSALA